MQSEMIDILDPTERVSKDILNAMRKLAMTAAEARFLVDYYYQLQKERIISNNRLKGLERAGSEEPHEVLDWFYDQSSVMEQNVAKALAVFARNHEMWWFFDQTKGVGPVISAGLIAHIDIEKAQTAGAIWRFAGLDPNLKWEKGQKRPFNGALKTLCWKLGESFVKVSNREGAFYGQLYKERKQKEWEKNLRGDNAPAAAAKLERFKIGKTTDAYQWYSGQCSAELAAAELAASRAPSAKACKVESGGVPMLPPDHVQSRAKRFAVKMFLSHLHQCWREERGLPVPAPWVIVHGGHVHHIAPPQVKP